MLRIAEEALTFDDVLLLPAHSSVLPKAVSLKTPITSSDMITQTATSRP